MHRHSFANAAPSKIHSQITLGLRRAVSILFACSIFSSPLSLAQTTPTQPATTPSPAAVAATPPAAGATTPAAPATSPSPPADPAVVGDHNRRLSDRIPASQQLLLQAGDDQFAARYIADLSPNHRGAVIVLPDSGHHQSWPHNVAALLDDLPLYGWDVMALELPAPNVDSKPKPATVASGPQLETSAGDGVEKIVQARIDAAIKKLAELHSGKTEATVLLGFGSGSWRAAEFARTQAEGNGAQQPDPIRALVLIDALNRLPAVSVELPTLLPATTLMTLDLVQSSEPLARAAAEARRRAVLKQKERIYQQLFLPPLNATDATAVTPMIKRIRSWIQLHVPIPEAEKKVKASP